MAQSPPAQQQQLQQGCLLPPADPAQGKPGSRNCHQQFWGEQLHRQQYLQQSACLPAVWFALARLYKEGGRIKHRWLQKAV